MTHWNWKQKIPSINAFIVTFHESSTKLDEREMRTATRKRDNGRDEEEEIPHLLNEFNIMKCTSLELSPTTRKYKFVFFLLHPVLVFLV
jgi:hypothetical protein